MILNLLTTTFLFIIAFVVPLVDMENIHELVSGSLTKGDIDK